MKSLELIYLQKSGAKIPKVELAYEILSLFEERPGLTIVDPRRNNALKAVAESVVNHFQSLAV